MSMARVAVAQHLTRLECSDAGNSLLEDCFWRARVKAGEQCHVLGGDRRGSEDTLSPARHMVLLQQARHQVL